MDVCCRITVLTAWRLQSNLTPVKLSNTVVSSLFSLLAQQPAISSMLRSDSSTETCIISIAVVNTHKSTAPTLLLGKRERREREKVVKFVSHSCLAQVNTVCISLQSKSITDSPSSIVQKERSLLYRYYNRTRQAGINVFKGVEEGGGGESGCRGCPTPTLLVLDIAGNVSLQ